ncbi:P3 gene product [Spissistilus festinus reovirus]|uniref:major core capsid n=1 Tax=Spissistilus festinus reovirus TaxID=1004049 RepID=UPI00024D946E|nr:P3 gene product [Spissistilus festinus reovirus]AEC32489.1 major core capsid [Spissistilus festinus reovirus]
MAARKQSKIRHVSTGKLGDVIQGLTTETHSATTSTTLLEATAVGRQDTSVLPNSKVAEVPIKTTNVPKVPAAAQSGSTPELPKLDDGSKSSSHTEPVKLSDLTISNIGAPPPDVVPAAHSSAQLGVVPHFMNSLPLNLKAPLPPLIIPNRRIVGYQNLESTLQIPSTWGVRIISSPLPLVSSKALSLFNFNDEHQFSVSLDPTVRQTLIDPNLQVFKRGTNLVFYQLNDALFKEYGLETCGGVASGEQFVAPFILSATNQTIQMNSPQLVSGAIEAACIMMLAYNGLLVLEKGAKRSTSGLDTVPTLNWLQTHWTELAIPNPAMVYGFTGLHYFDQSMQRLQQFRYGKTGNLTLTNNIPLDTKWATTYDNITVELLGMAQRYIKTHEISIIQLIALLRAHSPFGTVFPESNIDRRTFLPIVMSPPDTMIGQLFLTIARMPSIKPVIAQLYINYVMSSGIIWEAPLRDVLTGLTGNALTADMQQAFYKCVGSGSFDSLIEALVFEIRPTFDYPSADTQRPYDRAGQYLCLFETLLFFVLFPKAAKFVADELANRIRHILKSIAPAEWARYVAITGFTNLQPGSDSMITRKAYIYNEQRPSLLQGAAANRGWQVMTAMAGLIEPIGEFVPRARAADAQLPTIDNRIFVPWDDVGDFEPDGTMVTTRINRVAAFMDANIIPLFRAVARQSSAQVSGFGAVNGSISSRAIRVGNGLGRGLHRLFCGMVDFSTNVIHSYDGSLATVIPAPVYLFDASMHRTTPLPVQSIDSQYYISTQVIWSLLYHIEFVFDSSLLLNSGMADEPVYAELATPAEVMNEHLSIYSFSEHACVGVGIANEILNPQNFGRPPYRFMYDILRDAKASGQLLSSSAYRRLETIISKHVSHMVVGKTQVEGMPNMNVTGDERYAQPIFRRCSLTKTPLPPLQNDPPILRGNPQILTEICRDMFEFGATVLLDPGSSLSRLMVGFALHRVSEPDVNFLDRYNPPNLPEEDITQLNFVTEDQDGRVIKGLRFNGNMYVDVNDVPATIFTIKEPGLLPSSSLRFMLALLDRGSVLVFPTLKFIYSVSIVTREAYDNLTARLDLQQVITEASTSIAHITLYSTYAPKSPYEVVLARAIRYFFPLSRPRITIAVKDLIGLMPEPTFQGPSEAIYDTGSLNDDWRNTYSTGLPKTYASLSISNEVIYRERGEGYFQLPTVECDIPNQLTMYQGVQDP